MILTTYQVLGLRVLSLGYPFIRRTDGAVLRTYNLCWMTPQGWMISDEGRKCLEVWDEGYDYDPAEEDRKHRNTPRGEVAREV